MYYHLVTLKHIFHTKIWLHIAQVGATCNEYCYCIECCSTIFPFNSLSSNKNFHACCTNTDNNTTQWIDLENDHNSSLSLKRSSNLELLVNQFNNATPENSNDPEKVCS